MKWWIKPLFALEIISVGSGNNVNHQDKRKISHVAHQLRIKAGKVFRKTISCVCASGDWTVDNHQQKTNFSITFLNGFTIFAARRLSYADITEDFLIIFLRETLFLNELIGLAGFYCDCAHTPDETIVISHCWIFLSFIIFLALIVARQVALFFSTLASFPPQ